MRYVGLDVHWRQSTFCVLDANGKTLCTRTIVGPWDKVLLALGQVKPPFAVCFEASTGYGYLYERLGAMAAKVIVAHPGQLRLIFRSKRKNDRVDAAKLAKLLYLDEVPPVYVPGLEVRDWRSLLEHRQRLLQERTRAKNQVRALLRQHGVKAPRGLWTKAGMKWLLSQGFAGAGTALQRDLLCERIGSLHGMVKRVEAELANIASRHPGVALLRTIPGVGLRTAEAVLAYIDDPERFASVKAVAAYFGVVPCQDQSAQKQRLGHITRQGPATVRKLLTEAAWVAIRRSPTVKAYFERLHHGDVDRRKIAVTATAHYLLRVMHAMLRTGEVWRGEAA
ncbi:MAG TPA: IS110 family transposase [Chromatiales bacterium]|nr:IS110 family transposase [Chromatiales bacterium]